MAGGVDALRHNTIGFLQDYFILLDVRDQNRKLKAENDKLRMDNIYLPQPACPPPSMRAAH